MRVLHGEVASESAGKALSVAGIGTPTSPVMPVDRGSCRKSSLIAYLLYL